MKLKTELFTIVILLGFLIFGACKKAPTTLLGLSESDSVTISSFFDTFESNGDIYSFYEFKANDQNVDTNLYTKLFFYNQQSVHAFKTGNLSLAEQICVDSVLTHESIRNTQIAKSYNILGNILFYSKKVEECIEAFQNSSQIFEELNELKEFAKVQVNLGNIFISQLNFPLAHKFAQTAYQTLADLPAEEAEFYYPLAASFYAIASLKIDEHIQKPERLIEEAETLNASYNHPQVAMLILYAKAEYNIKIFEYRKAIQKFEESIEIAKTIGDMSFITIASTSIIFCHYQLKEYEKVIKKGTDILDNPQLANFKDILYALHKHLGNSYFALNNYPKAYHHISEAEKHYSEKINTESQLIIQDLMLKYDSEKKQIKILQQELEIRKSKNLNTILLAFTFLIIGALIVYLQLKKRNTKQEILLSLQEGEQNERLRIANELHDGIASDLVGLKMLLELKHIPDDESSHLSQLIKRMHTDVRKIAHNLAPINFKKKSLSTAIEEWLGQFDENAELLIYETNYKGIYLSRNTSAIVYRVAQEIIQNAIKHSAANEIKTVYKRSKNHTKIIISDNGRGLLNENLSDYQEKLKKLNERMKAFGGKVYLSNKTEIGTKVIIKF